MKKEYDNTNRGALFKNNDPKSDKSPEYTGTINVDGREFYLSGWVKEKKEADEDGKKEKFFSLSVKPKEQKQAVPQKAEVDKAYAKAAAKFDSDEIPFALLIGLTTAFSWIM